LFIVFTATNATAATTNNITIGIIGISGGTAATDKNKLSIF
jgi:hypothetical protein